MIKTELLEKKITESGMKKCAIAKKMGFSRHTLNNKISGLSQVTASDIVLFADVLGLSKSERDSIFLSKKVN